MAYRDENGKITIDDVAAGEDIKKIERADRKSTRLNSSHNRESRMPSSA